MAHFTINTKGFTPAQKAAVAAAEAQAPKGTTFTNTESLSYGTDAKTGQPVGPGNDTPIQQGSSAPPATNLQPGQSGTSVQQLQNYLTQMGYLSPQQVTGQYDTNTTAAVAQLQKNLGVDPGQNAGYYGPKTQTALAQKYQSMYQNASGTPPQTAADAASYMGAYNNIGSPYFDAYAQQSNQVMQMIGQVLANVQNTALSSTGLQEQYNNLAAQNNLPALNTERMNLLNVMTGTEQDIRNEVSSSGGMITESQVMALTASRNHLIMQQFNSVDTAYQAGVQNVQNMMQFASEDRTYKLQAQSQIAGLLTTLDGLLQTRAQMGMTMQQNAATNYRAMLTAGGPDFLRQAVGNDPYTLANAETALNMAPGTLSNPTLVQSMQQDQYKTQAMALNAYRANISAFNAGYQGGAPTPSSSMPGSTPYTASTQYGTHSPATGQPVPGQDLTTVDPSTLVRPSWLGTNVPLNPSAETMQGVISQGGKNVTVDDAGNVTVNGVGYYIKQGNGSYILGSSIPANASSYQDVNTLLAQLNGPKPPTLTYPQIAAIIQNAPGSKFPPNSTAFYRQQRSARQLVANYISSPIYQIASQAPLQFGRVQAAINGDNSVSDVDLLDAAIMMAKGTGQVTQGQIEAIQGAASYKDKLNILYQRIFGQGAALSGNQRQDILKLDTQLFNTYSHVYQNLYTQAVNVLAKNHVEPAVWSVVPDFSTMITVGDTYAQ